MFHALLHVSVQVDEIQKNEVQHLWIENADHQLFLCVEKTNIVTIHMCFFAEIYTRSYTKYL